MKFASRCGSLWFLLLASSAQAQQPGVAADLLLLNGKIWTVNPKQPEAEAVAVWQGRILAVGKSAELKPLAGPATKVIDLQGRRVVPGFIDSHLHLLNGGTRLSQVSLRDAKDEADFGKRLQEFDKKLPKDRWLLGGEWDHDLTFGGRLPTAAILDKYVPERPVFLRRYDGHMGVVNTRALQLAGITAKTADPAGGVIYRKPDSQEPTGLLRDNAMELVARLVPPLSDDEILQAIQAALKECRQQGVTGVVDLPEADPATLRRLFQLYQRLARAGQLTCRIDLRLPLANWKQFADLGITAGFGDDWVKIGGLKGFIDGSLGSSTAKFFDPYIHEPTSTGVYLTPLNKLREDILSADKAGLAVCVHAIGDRGNAELLDIFAEAIKQHGPRDRRFRVEHTQHLRPVEYPRFAALGVIPSMQPYHIIDDGRWAENRIGPKRCASSYALRSLLDAKAKIAFGSDWPVVPISPLLGIDAAAQRRTLDGKHPQGWFPEQRITVAEAIEAYTLTGAHAVFAEKVRGSLEVGKLADLAVLSRDILAEGEKEKITETQVVLTVIGGRIVFEK
ncbi:MAG: amidohydrolase [Planctomycetia bacterium]|nr:amidohydrolase [Planctomycetia bacterium]